LAGRGVAGRLKHEECRASLTSLALSPSLTGAVEGAAEAFAQRFAASHATVFIVSRGNEPFHASFPVGEGRTRTRRTAPDPGKAFLDTLSVIRPGMGGGGEEAAFMRLEGSAAGEAGVSWMQAPLRDGRTTVGLVAVVTGSRTGYGGKDSEALGELAGVFEGVVRRLLDLEELGAERELLSAEAALLARTAGIEDEEELLRTYAAGIRLAIQADALGIIEPATRGNRARLFDDPPGVLGVAASVATHPGNAAMLEDIDGAGTFYNPDLQRNTRTPGEQAAAAAGQRTFLVTQGRAPGLPVLIVTATSMHRDRFRLDARSFVSRLATVLQLSLDRLRSGAVTVAQRERLDAQARLLTSLNPAEPLQAIAGSFAAEARSRFEADYVAVVYMGEDRTDILCIEGDIAPLTDEVVARGGRGGSYATVSGGEAEVVMLAERERNAIEDHLYEQGLRWLARVPVRGGSSVLGFVTLGGRHGTQRARTEDLEEFLRPLGLALERARLLRSLERRNSELATANGILTDISDGERLEEACGRVAGRLTQLFAADHVGIGFQDLVARTRTLLGWESTVLEREGLPVDLDDADTEAYDALQRGATTVVADLTEELDLHPSGAAMRAAGLRAVMRAPFSISAEMMGVVTVASLRPGAYTQREAALLAELVRPMGLAVDRARVLRRLAEISDQTLAQNRLLMELTPSVTQQEIAERFCGIARQHFQADGAVVGVLRPEDEELEILAADTPGIPTTPRRYRMGSLDVERVAHSGEPRLIGDALDASAPKEERPLVASGVRCFMDVPIQGSAGTHGLVIVFSKEPNYFRDEHLSALVQLTRTLGERLELRALDEQAREHVGRVEAANRVMAAMAESKTEEEVVGRFLDLVEELFAPDQAAIVTLGDGTAELAGARWAESSEAGAYPLELAHEAIAGADPDTPAVIGAGAAACALDEHFARLGYESGLRLGLAALDGAGSTGMVELRGREAQRFKQRDVALLAAVARPLALAIEGARAVGALAESEERYRSLVGQAEEMIFAVDGATRRIVEANPYFARALGYEPDELRNLYLDDVADAPAEVIEANFGQVIETGQVRIPERRYRRKDGTTIDVEIVASRITLGGRTTVLALARDLTERRSLQRQLLQAQKMESLGTMAGQVAHDFNNLLTTIMGFSGMLKRSPSLTPEEKENLELIEHAARRGADLTGRLLAFARGGLSRFGPLDLGKLVEETMKLAAPTLHRNIRVSMKLPSRPLLVEGDPSQLQQALLNIVLNARDAMPEGGEIAVALAKRGTRAEISLADDGPGMDDETRLRIFEPFFTTKATGAGTGLGLAITYGIVQAHGGELRCNSAPGKGATFTISLPLAEG
jgi:PAS domain S-box-containing protein